VVRFAARWSKVSYVAPRRQPKTLLEANVLLALGSLLTPEQLAAGRKLAAMEQARLMVKAMPKAARVAEFVSMWTIAKYQVGEVTVERLAEYWQEPVRTMYRRLDEFRQVWGPAGFDTPDRIADGLIADYKGRKERLSASHVARLLSAPVSVPIPTVPGVRAS
jgi:hypothetical protein